MNKKEEEGLPKHLQVQYKTKSKTIVVCTLCAWSCWKYNSPRFFGRFRARCQCIGACGMGSCNHESSTAGAQVCGIFFFSFFSFSILVKFTFKLSFPFPFFFLFSFFPSSPFFSLSSPSTQTHVQDDRSQSSPQACWCVCRSDTHCWYVC